MPASTFPTTALPESGVPTVTTSLRLSPLRSALAATAMLAIANVCGGNALAGERAPSTSEPRHATLSSPYEALAEASGRTILVLKDADRIQLENDMFEFFGNNASAQAKREIYQTKFTKTEQSKVLEYYRIGKASNLDAKKFKYAIYDIFNIVDTTYDIKESAKLFQKTGTLDGTNQSLVKLYDRAMTLLPDAYFLFNRSDLQEIDNLWDGMMRSVIAKLEAEKQQLSAEKQKIQENIVRLRELNRLLSTISR
jgi:hypothetical protein